MDFFDLASVNQKLTFSLTADVEAKQHSCLVRKIKGALMAVVISNRDKDKITLSVDDDIYFFHDLNDETCLTRARIAQNQSYPLVIVDMTSEPVPISGPREPSLPSMLEGIESVENDHLVSEPVDEPVAGLSGIESIGVEPVDETPENELLSELLQPGVEDAAGGEMAETDAGKSGELLVERVDMEDVIVLDDELMNIPDIDTSELEAELEADIADSLEEEVEEPDLEEREPVCDELDGFEEVYADDSLEDMEIKRSELLDIGEIGGREPVSEADDGAHGSSESHLQAPEALKEPVGAEAEPFEDFFGFEFVVVDSETAEKLEGVINKYSSEQRFSFDAAEEIEDLDFIENNDDADDAGVKGVFSLKNLLTRPARAENRAERFSGNAADNQLSFVSEISEGRSDPIRSAICLKIDKTGIHAVLDGPLSDGACVLLMVNRSWNPPLRFDAVAVLLDSESGADGISSGKFRFIAIHSDDAGSLDDYLRRGSEYLSLLKQMTHG